ncbi:TPA: DUF4365 domain-containing protein [Bacillus thuringiensis]|uniref:DUF4365 domain-containing protein n=1 Tax=Bacillus thuringiensis TaxID=1428 RepID=UPI0018CFD5BB|nr:DUF4365 domain-containing protein [Bacillus thuringiensis]MBG9703280.1 hypothetical protein [Bacillus thuringiensis]MEB9532423.1 DUF4365 domain-containing protein [Bacillus cereus]MEB9724359.1 DUF4365 domain-containing protein [Bacillus cereus]
MNLPMILNSKIQETESYYALGFNMPHEKFIIRDVRDNDYGVDLEIELIDGIHPTNFRSHIQLKSTKKILKNNEISFPVSVKNINYLLNHPHSIYIIYLKNEKILMWEWVWKIYKFALSKDIETTTTKKKHFNYHFNKVLNEDAFNLIYKSLLNVNTGTVESRKKLLNSNENKSILEIPTVEYSLVKMRETRIIGNNKDEIIMANEDKIRLANDLIIEENYEKAFNIFQALLTIYETDFLYKKCIELLQIRKDYSKCINYCNEYLELFGISLDVLMVKGVCFFEENNINQSIIQFKQCLELDNAQIEIHMNLLRCYILNEDYSNMFYYLKRIIQIDESAYTLYRELGDIFRSVERYELAIACYEEALIHNKKDKASCLGLALTYTWSNQIDKASIYFLTYARIEKIPNNKFVGIVDVERHKTNFITIKKSSARKIEVLVNNQKIIDNMSTDKDGVIFIGELPITDRTGASMNFPCLGKFYQNKRNFRQVKKHITTELQLPEFFGKYHYLDLNQMINATIEEKEQNVYIELNLNGYQVNGFTNATKDNSQNKLGFKRFVELFDKYEQCKIVFQHAELQDQVNITLFKEQVSIITNQL